MNKANTKTQGKKAFPPNVGFWPSKKDANKYTVYVDDKIKDQLSKAQVGGRLLLTRTPEERIEQYPNIAHFQVTIFEPSEEGFQNKKQETGDSL